MNKTSFEDEVRKIVPFKGYNSALKAYIRHVERNKHYFFKFHGYSFDLNLLEQMENKRVELIVIYEKDTENILISDLHTWSQSGKPYASDAFGPQIVLEERLMTVVSRF